MAQLAAISIFYWENRCLKYMINWRYLRNDWDFVQCNIGLKLFRITKSTLSWSFYTSVPSTLQFPTRNRSVPKYQCGSIPCKAFQWDRVDCKIVIYGPETYGSRCIADYSVWSKLFRTERNFLTIFPKASYQLTDSKLISKAYLIIL